MVPHRSVPVWIFMVRKANGETKKDYAETRKEVDERSELLVTLNDCWPMSNTVVRQVVLRSMFEVPVLVSERAIGLIELTAHANVTRDKA